MKRLLLALIFAAPVLASTTITDTLHKADGSTCSGSINISWSNFYDNNNSLVYAGSVQTPVINGLFSVSLATGYVNASNPSGFGYYSVAYNVSPTGCVPQSANWNVYASGSPLNLNSVQSFNAPITQTVIPLSWLSPAGAVTGWCIAWNGTTYAPTSCAASGASYNQGSTNAVTQTVTGKLQQTIALDDFGCTPTNTASQNNVPCQNAINYAAAQGMAIHCAGTYQISVSLVPPATQNEVIIWGESVAWTYSTPANTIGGCTIQQTNAAVAVISISGMNYSRLVMRDLRLLGGTNSVEVVQGSLSSPSGSVGGPLTFEQVTFQYYTHAGIYIDGFSAVQGMNTTRCRWLAGANTANGVWEDAASISGNPGVNGFLVTWTSTHDFFSGGLHGIYADSDGNSGGWTFIDARFQDMYGSPVVLLGNIAFASFKNFNMEATGAGDNGGSFTSPQWNTTTGTTTGTNSSTIVVASGTRLGAGTTLHISQAAQGNGNTTLGIDFDTVIQSCSPSCGNSGSTTLTVSPVIPLIVTGVPVTNSQSVGFDIETSPVNTNRTPGYLTFSDSLGCITNFSIGDASSCRYTVYNPNGVNIGIYNIQQGSYNYDPGGYFNPVVNVAAVRTAPFTKIGSFVQPWLKTFNGSTLYPTIFSGNPGANGGEFHWGCGDANTTTFSSTCASTGTYGDVTFMANNANRGRPAFNISYNTGTVAIGPNFNIGGALANLTIGAVTMQSSLSNGISMLDGVAPTTHTAGNNQIVAVSGTLYHYDPSGVAHNLDTSGIALTTTGSSGASTLIGSTLNIPVYGSGSGTVSVVGGGSLTSTAFMTGGGTTTAQTPSATSTLDSSGDAVFQGTLTAASGLFGASPPTVTGSGLFALAESTAPTGAASGVDLCYASSSAHGLLCSFNNSSYFGVTRTIASGATALGTPTVASGACSSAITATATGALTTDVLEMTPAVDQSGISGYGPSASGSLYIIKWVTANTANFKVCNNTSGSITPAAMTMNWRISR